MNEDHKITLDFKVVNTSEVLKWKKNANIVGSHFFYRVNVCDREAIPLKACIDPCCTLHVRSEPVRIPTVYTECALGNYGRTYSK